MLRRTDHPQAVAVEGGLTTPELAALGTLGAILHGRGGQALRSELMRLAVTEAPRTGPRRLSHKRARQALAKGAALGYFVIAGDDRDPLVTLVPRGGER